MVLECHLDHRGSENLGRSVVGVCIVMVEAAEAVHALLRCHWPKPTSFWAAALVLGCGCSEDLADVLECAVRRWI